MRVFIAIDFNELSDYFTSLQKKLLPLPAKFSFTKTFHLTLKFLGEVPQDKIDAIKDKLKTAKFTGFSVSTGNIGFFPDKGYIRVIWVGMNPEEQAIELSKRIDDTLKDMFRTEKNFKPHITLARINIIEDKKGFINLANEIKTEEKKALVRNFCLVKSTLSPKGAIHEVLEKYP